MVGTLIASSIPRVGICTNFEIASSPRVANFDQMRRTVLVTSQVIELSVKNRHSKTSFEKNCFSAWASTLNMGLINKVDMVCLSPVGYGV